MVDLSRDEHGRAPEHAATITWLTELARRERQHGAIPVSDLLRPAGIDAGHTVNHPGNTVLVGLARRIEEAPTSARIATTSRMFSTTERMLAM